ncbi:(Fe-S)-binding protein [Yinghuangia soli]|uniref:4Fe-4S dicluster domain-containing protein n=1 Tax=Yinghuangia soli TaxID=2908204 RepID=A0AA41PUA8_9ACTN|nr:(Fe-S)-binding protein [Yinghuangia soli]MCF2525836.1 4Fe-4S dicluster domain-containing protein [Yinghuangia soli]
MVVRLVIGLAITAVAFALAGRRLLVLYRLGKTGQPVERDRTQDLGTRLWAVVTEVFGQRKLLQWTGAGAAHFAVFWGFVILGATIVEGYGALFDEDFHIPLIGKMAWLGALEDTFIVAVLVGLVAFAAIRLRQDPAKEGRGSRFYGSHTGAAWVVLLMIFNVMWTLLLFRGAQTNAGTFPFDNGAYASEAVGKLLEPAGEHANEILEHIALLLSLAVVLSFLVIVVHSKHMHIFTAPFNVALSRRPRGLGAALPVQSGGKPIDWDDPQEDDKIGRGAIEDFTWKGLLDFATCTECGRCQSQCPAWNTGKPLSPKLLIMALRDHALAKAPYLLAGSDEARAALPEQDQAEGSRPLVGTAEDRGVIDPDVLWSCVTCGACVEQCPVDIEHVDHILDMRRYQVMMESEFPKEAGSMLRNLERKGDPWGRGAKARLEWAKKLPFEIRVLDGGEIPEDVEWLYWVGCAGSLDDTAMKTSRSVAELLHEAGVSFAVLGKKESCTGDAARRLGNEMLFQELAGKNVETLNTVFGDRPADAKKIVVTCAHCFNAIGNEYPQLGGNYEVVHHTELLAKLVSEGRLVPENDVDAAVTYHDPCYLGRHNRVFSPPRQILESVPGVRLTEMPRNRERSFCCGAGGARMWVEETIGTRINETRTDEALETEPDLVTAACPYCIVMLTDGVATRKQEGKADEAVRVTDVSEVLLRSIKRREGMPPTAAESAAQAAQPAGEAAIPAQPAAPPPGSNGTAASADSTGGGAAGASGTAAPADKT